jgi:hypothetical protein
LSTVDRSSYALKLAGDLEPHGPFTKAEVREKLESYRQEHPGDDTFFDVEVWEMRPHTTVGRECSVFEFFEQ